MTHSANELNQKAQNITTLISSILRKQTASFHASHVMDCMLHERVLGRFRLGFQGLQRVKHGLRRRKFSEQRRDQVQPYKCANLCFSADLSWIVSKKVKDKWLEEMCLPNLQVKQTFITASKYTYTAVKAAHAKFGERNAVCRGKNMLSDLSASFCYPGSVVSLSCAEVIKKKITVLTEVGFP